MSLGRAWMEDLLRASATALLVPGALLASIAALALSGGFGALGSIGQAFGGPSLPTFATPPKPVGSGVRAAHRPSAIAVALAAPAARTAGRLNPGSGGTTGSRPAARPSHSAPGSFHQGGGPAPGTGAHQPPPTGGSATPAPAPRPTLIDGVVSLGSSVTQHVPAPVSSLTTQTLRSAGRRVNGIVAPHSSPTRSGLGGVVGRLYLP